MPFDVNQYFSRRYGAGNPNKLAELAQASQDKVNQLVAFQESKGEIVKPDANPNEGSWVNQLGLDSNSKTGEAVNLAASFASGATRVAGHIAALPFNVGAMVDEYGLNDADAQAYARYKQDIASPEDVSRLSQRTNSGGATVLELFDRAAASRKTGLGITELADTSKIVHQGKRDALHKALAANFDSAWEQTKQGASDVAEGNVFSGGADVLSGVGRLIYNAGEAALTNKAASAEYIVENIPQLLGGLVGKAGKVALTASNVGYGADLYSQGIKRYQEANDGALPSVEQRQEMAMHAAGAIFTEQAGDLVQLGAIKAVGKAAKEGTEALTRTGFKESLKNTLKAGAEGVVSEAPTEGYQTYAEGQATLKPASPLDIYQGTAIGGIAGGGLTGGGRAVAEVLGATPEKAAQRAQEQADIDTFVENARTNNTADYLDRNSKSYNPAKAVAVHLANSQAADTTPEARQQNVEKAHDIIAGLESQRSDLQNQLDQMTPEGIQQRIDSFKARLDTAPPELASRIQTLVDGLQDDLNKFDPKSVDPKTVKSLKTQIASLDRHIEESTKLRDELVVRTKPQEADVEAAVTNVETPTATTDPEAVTASKAAAGHVVSLAMAHPDSFSDDHLNRLVASTNNGLSAAQRTYLRTLSQSRIAENALKTMSVVESEVMNGDPTKNQLGIKDYQQRMAAAITARNEEKAATALHMLGKFANGHTQKLRFVMEQFKNVGKGAVNILPTQQGWALAPSQDTSKKGREAIRELGGLTIHGGSTKLIRQIQAEVKALNAAHAQLKASYALRFQQPASVPPVAQTSVNQVGSTQVVDSSKPSQAQAASQQTPVNQSNTASNQSNTVDSTEDNKASSTRANAPVVTAKSIFRTLEESWQAQEASLGETNSAIEAGRKTEKEGAPLVAERDVLIAKKDRTLEDDLRISELDDLYMLTAIKNDPINELNDSILTWEEEKADLEKHPEDVGQDFATARIKAIDSLLVDARKFAQRAEALVNSKGSESLKELGYTQATQNESGYNTATPEVQAEVTAILTELNAQESNTNVTTNTSNEPAQTTSGKDEAKRQSTVEGSNQDSGEDGQGQPEETTFPEGQLAAISQAPAPKGTLLTEVSRTGKLFATYLKQTVQREGDTTQRPLVAVKDFLTKLAGKIVKVSQFLPEGFGNGTQEQRNLVGLLINIAPAWFGVIQKETLAKTADPTFNYNDPVLELLVQDENGQLDLPENVKTAMVYAGMSYVIEQGARPTTNTDEYINKMLSRPEEFEVLQSERNLLGQVMGRRATVANALGRRAVQALGITDKADAPVDFLPRMEAALGGRILTLLVKEGIMAVHPIRTSELATATFEEDEQFLTAEEFEERKKRDEKVGHIDQIFISMSRDVDNNLGAKAQRIIDVAVGSKGILDTLFSVESGAIMPTLQPVDFTQTKTGRGQDVPQKQKIILQKHNAQEHRIKEDVFHTYFGLSLDAQVAVASGEVVTNNTQAMLIDGIKARNQALEREIKNFNEFVNYVLKNAENGDDVFKTPFFFQHDVWNQFRVGILNNLVNPQMSKIVRHLVKRNSWEADISFDNPNQLKNFKLRVLESFGVRTNNEANLVSEKRMADLFLRKEDRTGIDASDKFTAINAAVDALVEQLNSGELTTEQEAAIVKGVKEAGEKMFSFDGLVAMAQFRIAQQAGKPSFKTAFIGEIDGVSNGPIMAHLLFGAADNPEALAEFLKKGGFYSIDDALENYNDWRGQPGNHDLYEGMTVAAFTVLERHKEDLPNRFESPYVAKVMLEKYAAVQSFIGNLMKEGAVTSQGRNLSKEPIRPLVFGSSKKRAIESMAQSYIESIAKQLQKLPDDTQARQAALVNLNKLLWTKEKNLMVPINLSKEGVLQLKFTEAQRKAIIKSFKDTFGRAYGEAIDTELGTFLERRDQITRASGLSFALYNAAVEALRGEYIQELIDKGEMDYYTTKETGERKPRHGLTKAQERAFQKTVAHLAPMVHTMYSLEEGSLSAGLPGYKNDLQLSENPLNKATVHYPSTQNKSGIRTESINTMERVLASPSVNLTSMPIHAADSYDSSMANPEGEHINLHDAQGTGLNGFTQMGQNLNRVLWDVALNYSPILEVANSLQRTIQGVAGLLQRNHKDMTPAQRNALLQHLSNALAEFSDKQEMDANTVIESVMASILGTSIVADHNKLTVLAKIGALDQYASEGARFKPEDSDRAAAEKQLAEVKQRELEEKTQTGIQLIQNMTESAVEARFNELSQQRRLKAGTRKLAKMSVGELQQTLRALALDKSVERAIRENANKLRKLLVKEGATFRSAQTESGLSNKELDAVVLAAGSRLNAQVLPSQWVLGKPNPANNDATLVDLFKNRESVSAKQMLAFLQSHSPKTGGNTAFYQALAERLMPLVGDKLRIVYLSQHTDPALLLDVVKMPSYGWYSYDPDTHAEEIYIMGKDFKDSAINAELLLHELTHAALAKKVALEQEKLKADPNYTSEALQLIQELQGIMQQAKEHIDQDANLANLAPAVESLQEFLAWGMTNQGFQDKVLKQLSVKNPSKLSALTDGFKAFVKNIVSLVMGKQPSTQQDGSVNAMTLFLRNTAALIESVKGNEAPTSLLTQNQRAATHYTTTEILDALPGDQNNPAFTDHLRGLLASLVSKLYDTAGVIGDRVVFQRGADIGLDWQSINTTPAVPFASKALAAGIPMNDQVAFVLEQVEATVQGALDANTGEAHDVLVELNKLYKEVRAKLENSTSLSPGLRDFLFQVESGAGNRTRHLAQFAALGLAHPEINAALKMGTSRTSLAGSGSFAHRLEALFQKVLEWFNGRLTHTFAGQPADEKLSALVRQLVEIEAKRKAPMLQKASAVEFIEDTLKRGSASLKNKAEQLGKSKWIRDRKNSIVRASGAVLSTVAGDRTEEVMNYIQNIRDRQTNKGFGLAMGIVNEIRGMNDGNKMFHRLIREAKLREGIREDLITHTSNVVLESFANQGKDLSQKDKAALSAGLLRTDIAALLDHHTMAEITELLSNPVALDREITRLEGLLAPYRKARGFQERYAKNLGYKMATGQVKGHHLLMNAANIARLVGTGNENFITEADAVVATPIIDQLASLYAYRYTDNKHKDLLKNILQTETARGNANGVEMVLKLHKSLQEQSRERLFEGSEALMMKGYTPEIYDPKKEAMVATAAEGAKLVAQGYTQGKLVSSDPLDPDKADRYVYKRDGGGLRPWLSTIFSYTGEAAKGSRSKTDNVKNLAEWTANKQDLRRMAAHKQTAVQREFRYDPSYDPSKVEDNFAAPVLNAQGKVTDYRYLMQEENKDDLLNRDNRFDKILGFFAGNIYDKESTKENNRKAVQALFDQYNEDFVTRSESYRKVGPDSADAELRDIYRMLPDDTKKAIKEIWGTDYMMVRSDLMDINFGYRKVSLTDAFHKEHKNVADRLFTGLMMHTMGEKAEYNLRRAEDIWQEIVAEAKEILVIKNLSTLLGNIGSNISLLYWHGVPLKDMARYHRIALKGVSTYRQDSAALIELETQLAAGYITTSKREMEHEIARLKDAIARNPVKELIDAGLMPSIVEDVSPDDDMYSYKSRLVNFTGEHTQWVNKHVAGAARVVYMAKDTKMYKALHHATQLSDFVARYALYAHVTTRRDNPMSKEDAAQLASDSFINYDLPSHRKLQYMNDMGFVQFTKYYLRIQKVIARLYAENPGRAMALLVTEHFFSAAPMVTDSGFVQKLGNNPFEPGAFNYLGALDELATIKWVKSVL